MIRKLLDLVNLIPALHPFSTLKLLWDSLQLLLTLILFFIIPLTIAFNMLLSDFFLLNQQYYSVLICIMVLDIPLNFLTGFFENGSIVLDLRAIGRHYLKTNLLYDTVSACSLILHYMLELAPSTQLSEWRNIILPLFYCRTHSLKLVFNRLEITFKFTQRAQLIIQLLYLLVLVVFIAHFFACVWIFLGRTEAAAGRYNWLEKRGVDLADWSV